MDTLVGTLKKYHCNPVETGLAPSACKEPEKEQQEEKVIRAATVTRIPGWPMAAKQPL